jgi:hypothetical protein
MDEGSDTSMISWLVEFIAMWRHIKVQGVVVVEVVVGGLHFEVAVDNFAQVQKAYGGKDLSHDLQTISSKTRGKTTVQTPTHTLTVSASL